MSELLPPQNLEQEIAQAISDPASANLQQLLNELDKALPGLSKDEQLRTAGKAFLQLAEVCAARAEYLFNSWEEKYNPEDGEPIITFDMLQEVLRQHMTLSLEEILEDLPPQQRRSRQQDSVVREVEKAALLEFVDALEQEQEKQQVLAVAHDESISAWVSEINHWLASNPQEITLVKLHKALKMPLIQVWMALLLGGFLMEQRGNFYQLDSVWILNH